MNRRCGIAMLTALALAASAGCGNDTGKTLDAGADVADVGLPGDVPFEPGAPAPSAWCPPQDAVDRDTALLPRPWRVVARTDAQLTTVRGVASSVSVTGGDASDQAHLARILAELDASVEGADPSEASVLVVVHPEAEWAKVTDACVPDLPPVAEAHYLRLRASADGAGNEIHLFAPAETGRRMAWQTIRQILLGTPVPTGDFAIADAPATAMRGVIETFYGPSWKRDDRLALMPMFAAMKFNTYIYASKMDPFTNWLFDYWKDGWGAEHLAELAELAAAARDAGMLAGIQVRPLAAVTFSSDDDRNLFVQRVGELLDVGFDLFSLSFDDTDRVLVPEDQAVFDSYDQAVMEFAADVLDQLHKARPELVLGFVPNDYWSDAPTAEDTLTMLGEALPESVSIGWTGAQIIPEKITADDAKLVAGWMQRKPLLGDNYPVLDHASADLFLGPLQGRASDLPGHLAGLLFNPMPYPFASLPGLATCADYAWNASAYDPEQSRAAMAIFLAGPGPAADALALMADTNRSPTIGGSPAPGLEASMAAFWDAFDDSDGLVDAAQALVTGFLAPLAGIGDDWDSVRSGSLRAEVGPWVAQLGRCGAAAVTAVELLKEKAAGQAIDPEKLSSWTAALDEARDYTPRPTAGVIQGFLDRAEEELVPDP